MDTMGGCMAPRQVETERGKREEEEHTLWAATAHNAAVHVECRAWGGDQLGVGEARPPVPPCRASLPVQPGQAVIGQGL